MTAGRATAVGAPIRFVLLVVGAWGVGRAWSVWTPDAAPVAVASRALTPPRAPAVDRADRAPFETTLAELIAPHAIAVRGPGGLHPRAPSPLLIAPGLGVRLADIGDIGSAQPGPVHAPLLSAASFTAAPFPPSTNPTAASAPLAAVAGASPAVGRPGRADLWRVDAFVFVRSGGLSDAVEPTLGGSQALVTARRQLTGRLSAAGRLTSALASGPGRQAEVAVGLGVRPVRALPVELVAERRVALSAGGRDAWQLRAVGGGQLDQGDWRLESYGQAGVVGTRSRDLFADGQLRASRRLIGPVRAGGLLSGAAQPGAARLDAGPQLRVDLPLAGAPLALLADYRVRIAGNAAPRSGPSLTLAASF